MKMSDEGDEDKAQLVWVKGGGVSSLANCLAQAASWSVGMGKLASSGTC